MVDIRWKFREVMLHFKEKAGAILRLSLFGILIVSVIGCQQESDSQADQQAEEKNELHDDSDHAHHHEAPHGGALVALGDHFAHLEFLLEEDTGELTAWVLDGSAENPIRLADSVITCIVEVGDESTMLLLTAVANELTGETIGNSSQFSATSDQLLGAERFDISIPTLTIKGQTLVDISFGYPEGNEGMEHVEGEAVHTDSEDDRGHDHGDGHDHDHEH